MKYILFYFNLFSIYNEYSTKYANCRLISVSIKITLQYTIAASETIQTHVIKYTIKKYVNMCVPSKA